MRKFTADFETTTLPTYQKEGSVRVWAYSICEIGDPNNFICGNNIEDFIKWCADPKENVVCYFHNAKFDFEYILSYLMSTGYTYIADKKDREDFTFTTLISDTGEFYCIEVFFKVKGKRVNKVKFLDSLKILNFSVDQIAKDFDLPIRKLDLDYDEYRPVGHKLTEHEIDYIRNDVEIMSRALQIMFDKGHTKMTIGSDALADYKDGFKNFRKFFPILPNDVDDPIRKSYKGGFTYLNPSYYNKIVKNGWTLDVNSLYPSVMASGNLLPYGLPEYFEGEYKYDETYPLYVICFTCIFDLKPNKIPTIQDKSGRFFFKPNEWIRSSNDLPVTLTLTSVDYELFKDHYNIRDPKYHYGYKFKAGTGFFDDYVNRHTEGKIQAKKEGNRANYIIEKLFLNSLYGKFGLNNRGGIKVPYIDDEGITRYTITDGDERETIYIPMATFITAYARYKTISTSQKITDWSLNKYGQDLYIYSDTDSISMRFINEEEDLNDLKKIIDIDSFKLGWWDLENKWIKAKFIRQKCYMKLIDDGTLNVTVAGLPKKLAPIMTFDKFKEGFTTAGLTTDDLKDMARKNGASESQIEDIGHKLTYKHVKGGVLLVDTDFTIK